MKNTKYTRGVGQAQNKKCNNAGQALVLTFLLLAAILSITLIISYIFAVEIRLAGDVIESAKAIMAADAGLEWMLFKERKVLPEDLPPYFNGRACDITDNVFTCYLDNASFGVQKITDDDGTILLSTGTFRNTKRALKVSY